MTEQSTSPTKTRTRAVDIQAHYDVSDEFLPCSRTPPDLQLCYFEPPEPPSKAQYAKIDLTSTSWTSSPA